MSQESNLELGIALKRTGIIIICAAALAGLFSLRPLFTKSHGAVILLEGFNQMGTPRLTNYMAVFAIHNPTSATLYYEGTPFPAYIIEQKIGDKWVADSSLPQPEVLESIFPGKNYRFSIIVPQTSNSWRVAVLSVHPSRAPILLRRYFQPRPIVVRGPEVSPVETLIASGGETGPTLATSAGR